MIEGGTPNTLFRRGVNKNSLPPGTEILVDGYQAKDGTMKGERQGHHVSGRTQTVHRLDRHRCAWRSAADAEMSR